MAVKPSTEARTPPALLMTASRSSRSLATGSFAYSMLPISRPLANKTPPRTTYLPALNGRRIHHLLARLDASR